jgi:O-antigen/teichoic acid export membrane protein
MRNKLFIHTSNYSIAALLTTIASFVSFPIITRVLSVEEYGLLSLVNASLTFLVAMGKGGLQHSVLRLYSDIKASRDTWNLNQYYSTVILGMLGLSVTVTVVWMLIAFVVPSHWWNNEKVSSLYLLASVLIVLRVTDSALINILRAQERSSIIAIFGVVSRYGNLLCVAVTLLYLSSTIVGFFIATIVSAAIVVVAMGVYVLRPVTIAPRFFSRSLLQAMVGYGIPMVGYEAAGILLNIGDRYFIQWIRGAEDLGIYAAVYNISEYMSTIIISSVSTAVLPMYLRIWAEEGKESTSRFILNSLHYYLLITLPIIAGVSTIGPEVVTLLASKKYAAGASIIPYLISAMVIDGTTVMFAAGLYVRKQSMSLMYIVVTSAVVNTILNLLLIPAYGITGAAIATLLSYLVLVTLSYIVTSKTLAIPFPWLTLAKFGLIALSMYYIINRIHTHNIMFTLILQIVTGIIFYSTAAFLFDMKSRDIVLGLISQLRYVKKQWA